MDFSQEAAPIPTPTGNIPFYSSGHTAAPSNTSFVATALTGGRNGQNTDIVQSVDTRRKQISMQKPCCRPVNSHSHACIRRRKHTTSSEMINYTVCSVRICNLQLSLLLYSSSRMLFKRYCFYCLVFFSLFSTAVGSHTSSWCCYTSSYNLLLPLFAFPS